MIISLSRMKTMKKGGGELQYCLLLENFLFFFLLSFVIKIFGFLHNSAFLPKNFRIN
jgi:hypothetical protein